MSKRLYFDHNASTPADPRVVERYVEIESRFAANPGSLHSSGRAALAILEESREQAASLFGIGPEEVLFVSGGTEANNIAVQTLGDRLKPVLCAVLEHPSVYEVAASRGCVEVPVDGYGFAQFESALESAEVGLVSAVHGQNEVGTVQSIETASEVAKRLEVPLHVDAAQTVGRVDLHDVARFADTVAISGHKHGGLRGCGVLLGRGVRALEPLFLGGGQEFGKRAGTPSPALAAANTLALMLAFDERESRAAAMHATRNAFEHGVRDVVSRVLTPREESLPNTSMCAFDGVDGRSLLPALDIAGVEASLGSACSSGSPSPPRVLSAMGLSDEFARCCVRFSFSHRTSVEDAIEGASRVVSIISRLRELSR